MTGFEPVNLILTKDALYHLSYMGMSNTTYPQIIKTERETGLEPATLSLEG